MKIQEMKIQDLTKHIDADDFNFLCEEHCEACKGQLYMKDNGCYETCDDFQSAVAIKILALTELWDGITHCEARKAEAICLFLQKLAIEKLSVGQKER